MNDNNAKSKSIEIKLRNVVHTVTSTGLSFTISGFSATTTHPDGSEHEVVFTEDFTDEEIVTSVSTDLEFSPLSSLKIERVPRKTVTYYMK